MAAAILSVPFICILSTSYLVDRVIAGSQLRRRGENFGAEQGSSYVISAPANSWDLQRVGTTEFGQANKLQLSSRARLKGVQTHAEYPSAALRERQWLVVAEIGLQSSGFCASFLFIYFSFQFLNH